MTPRMGGRERFGISIRPAFVSPTGRLVGHDWWWGRRLIDGLEVENSQASDREA